MNISKRMDINRAIDAMEEIFGSREQVFETMALCPSLDEEDITPEEYEQITESIAVKSRQERERYFVNATTRDKWRGREGKRRTNNARN